MVVRTFGKWLRFDRVIAKFQSPFLQPITVTGRV